jgi:imidazole glycerol-phosphate synthase subunit HisF
MTAARIIPCLDIDAGRVVKGLSFRQLRDIGDPAEICRKYASEGADEIVLLDISATFEGRGMFYPVIEKASSSIFVPISAGGGLKSVADIKACLRAGADKTSLNSAALKDPGLINEAARIFGSQCIVISIDAKRVGAGWHAFSAGGRVDSGRDAVEWAKEVVARGAGEILVNSIDRDGQRSGYDLELLRAVSDAVTVPVIASSGAGSLSDISKAFGEGRAQAALVASMLHDGDATIAQIKAHLRAEGILVR